MRANTTVRLNGEKLIGSGLLYKSLFLFMAIPTILFGGRLQPSDLVYLGAFRLPEVTTEYPETWDWSGEAMAYFPHGDPAGASDGFPGSLFATGLDSENLVSEFSIPVPLVTRNVQSLPMAVTLQPFSDVRESLFSMFVELPRVGMVYLPAQQGQSEGLLYLAWGQHYHEEPGVTVAPTHAWCGTDLSHPDTQGAWWVGTQAENNSGFIYRVNDYLMAIPDGWASSNTGGRSLATGRFRDGGWSGMGPNLYAIAPWLEGAPVGSPPAPNTEMSYVPLLHYSVVGDEEGHTLNHYSHADSWTGGAWIQSGGNDAVLFTGTKGSGYNWYGFYTPAGTDPPPLYPEGAPCVYMVGDFMCTQPDGQTTCTAEDIAPCEGAAVETQSRGWWSSRFDAKILFYDPADLARVAAGTMEPWEPQPYAVLDIDDRLFLNADMADVTMYNGFDDQRKNRLGSPAYDAERNLLYVMEVFADDYRPVIHLWRVNTPSRRHGRPFEGP
ncbi:MAG TPA: hypothetical protein PK014_08060 [Thermoanaerobaculia bacterium]|nr:hypothetical protein [Thermoanaerobaculia bacterium]HUM30217.1 hypothetical protein [Thermoanaerobaculia bacterium]HXK68334.1 hypothetical protein [Thermoanaerobaculia bacterium]